MRVAVIGAGVAGVTSAYYLAASGHDVTVVDSAGRAASGTSYANAGQLTYSSTDALARPSFLATVPGLVLGRDPAIRINLFTRPSLLRWGLRFLRECTAARADANTVAVLRLAMSSADCMREIRLHTGIDFAYAEAGKLLLLPERADTRELRASIELKKRHGCETVLVTMREAESIEPAVAGMPGPYSGAVWSANDEIGDARLFTSNLAAWLQREAGVRFRFGTGVRGIRVAEGRVRALDCDRDELQCDAAVVCAGADSPRLLRRHRIAAPVYPVRGYSITLPRGSEPPRVSVTDGARRLVYCPLANRIRIAGFADFCGFAVDGDERRIAELRRQAAAIAPGFADFDDSADAPWAGSRPMTPDGRPLVGETRVSGLYVNCGHGTLGWTLAAATAKQLAGSLDEIGRGY